MNSVFEEKGNLDVLIGHGFLSAFELSALKKGDVVQVARRPGIPYSIYFNDSFLCYGDAVVIDEMRGVRVTESLTNDHHAHRPGITDDVIELLPAKIRFGSIRLSLQELQGVSTGTIINLGKKGGDDVELIVAGLVVASGKVVYLSAHDNMGMRISDVYGIEAGQFDVRTSGYHFDPEQTKIEVAEYDFLRPDKFTRDAIEKTKNIHETFLMNLRAMSRDFKDYQVSRVDQMAFHEFVDEVESDAVCMIGECFSGPGRQKHGSVRSKARSTSDFTAFVQEEDSPLALDPEYFRKYGEWVREGDIGRLRQFLISFEKECPLEFSEQDPQFHETIMTSLRNAWKSVADLSFTHTSIATNPQEAKIVPDNDMILFVKFEDSRNPGRGFVIVYPYISIEPIVAFLQ